MKKKEEKKNMNKLYTRYISSLVVINNTQHGSDIYGYKEQESGKNERLLRYLEREFGNIFVEKIDRCG